VELAEWATGGGKEARDQCLFVRNFQCDKTHCTYGREKNTLEQS